MALTTSTISTTPAYHAVRRARIDQFMMQWEIRYSMTARHAGLTTGMEAPDQVIPKLLAFLTHHALPDHASR